MKTINNMKKKLILLPISLITCLLTGCDNGRHIEIKEFFGVKPDYSHVYIAEYEEDQYDYNHAIGDILAKYTSSAKKQVFYSNANAEPWLTYSFTASFEGFNNFQVYFYEDGKINTCCRRDSLFSSRKQETTYTISGEVIARTNEVDRIFAEEETKAKEYATTDKFFELLENPENNFKPWVDTYLDNSNQSKRFRNITPELIQDLRNLDYKEVEGANVPEEASYIEIRASDDWQLTIYKNVPYASSYYIYGNTLTITSLSVVYSINEEMRSALVNRFQEMIENNTYLK